MEIIYSYRQFVLFTFIFYDLQDIVNENNYFDVHFHALNALKYFLMRLQMDDGIETVSHIMELQEIIYGGNH